MSILLATGVRVTFVIVLALVAAVSMRKRAAAIRHWILAVGVICAVAMPALQAVAPAWQVPVASTQARAGNAGTRVAPMDGLDAVGITAPSGMIVPGVVLRRAVGWIWLAGVLMALALLAAGLARVARIAARCEPVIDGRWIAPLRQLAVRLHVRRNITLLQSDHERLLVTCGLWKPKIILPAGATAWTDARIRMVLCHELSHVRRRDWMLQVLAGLLRAVYWFNPVLWIACSWLRHESERASDDEVLSLGLSGAEYATELLDIARVLRPPAWSPAPGMARPSSLQRRVRAMLNANIDRRTLSPARRVAIAAAALIVAVAVAGSGAAAQAVGSVFSGSFVDALNNAIPNVTMTLKNTQTGEPYTMRSDSDGRFTFDALPDGDYQGEVNAVGFTTIHPFFRITDGKSVQPSVIALPLGRIEETITVKDDGSAAPAAKALALDRLVTLRQKIQTMPLAPPIKTRDVHPLFPPARKGEEATIFLEGIIDTNGFVKGLQVMQPADSEFGRAALDAVNEWQFEPTRLHGTPVDTSMHVTVRFVR